MGKYEYTLLSLNIAHVSHHKQQKPTLYYRKDRRIISSQTRGWGHNNQSLGGNIYK